MTLGRMVLLKWSSRVGALKSLLYTFSSSSWNTTHNSVATSLSHTRLSHLLLFGVRGLTMKKAPLW